MLCMFLAVLAGYLFGSVSVAVLLTRRYAQGDVRGHGSGNAGATNVARVYGLKAGLITLLGDMMKTAVSALIGWLLGGANGMAAGCAGCLIGHCWPLWFRFRGGKGVSVSACIALVLDWRVFLVIAATFAVAAVLSKRVSVGSMAAALVCPWSRLLLAGGVDAVFWVCLLMAGVVLALHGSNLRRLLRGEEPPFHVGGK